MATAPAIKTASFGSMAAGLNNRLRPTELAIPLPGGGFNTYLYAAENVDLDAHGRARRRRGVASALPSNAHSLWADSQGAYAVVDGALTSLADAGGTLVATTVRAGLPDRPLSYGRGSDNDVYWTNGVEIRRITGNNEDKPIVTNPPVLVPAVVIGAGGLAAGKYLVCVTIEDDSGESPASEVVQLDVPAGGALQITSLEPLTVYMSGPDGDILQRQGKMVNGSLTVSVVDQTQRRCGTLNMSTMPPGQIVRHFNGSMLVARGNVLYISEPYLYGLRKTKGYIPFPAPITVVETTGSGLYVCADQTYWFNDLTGGQPLATPLPYGGVLGSSGLYVKDSKAYWQSPRGLVIADDQGNAKAVQEEALAFGIAQSGASLLREYDGLQQIVTTRVGAQTSTAVAKSWMEAEVVRKGILPPTPPTPAETFFCTDGAGNRLTDGAGNGLIWN